MLDSSFACKESNPISHCVSSLKEERAEVNGRNWQGQTPLMVAAGHGHVSLDLLDLDFDV